jgi:aryl-alcohol dehydrogenase-like predicted oxidoreductase
VRYEVFGRHTGVRVSELVLGTGVFGTRWGHGSDPDEARGILDAYAEAGGNFIDPRTIQQLDDNLGATQLKLTAEQVARLDEVSAIPPVFPYTVIERWEYRQRVTAGKLDQLDLPPVPVA